MWYYYWNEGLLWGQLFKCWSSPSESAMNWPVYAPLLYSPQKSTHSHRQVQSGLTCSVTSLNLDKPQLKKVILFVFAFSPLLSPHKAVLTMYRPNNALMFRLLSLSACAKYFLDSSRFSRPPCVYFTWKRSQWSWLINCVKGQLMQ